MSDFVNIEQLNIAESDMGVLWLNFGDAVISEQLAIMNRAYTLISLVLKENSLSTIISTVLIDENIEISNKINIVKKTLLEGMVELLSDMGIILNTDFIELDSLSSLCDILDVLYSTDDIEDVLGLIDILDNETFDNKDKLIQIILRFLQKESFETDPFDYIIEEVSSDVIKGLYVGLGVYTVEDGDYINPDVARRIKANEEFLKDTFAYTHILNGGGVGLSYEVYNKLFINEIANFLTESSRRYMKETMGICLISSLTNVEITEGFEAMVKDHTESMDDIFFGTELLKKIKL